MSTEKQTGIAPAAVDNLIAGLDVDLVALSECLVNPGWRLDLGGADVPGIHYNLSGTGRLVVAGHTPIELEPHTLIVLPPRMPFQIHVAASDQRGRPLNVHDGNLDIFAKGEVNRHCAGGDEPHLIMICGHFRPTYGATVDLFSSLSSPIVERFGAKDRLDDKLKAALDELTEQQVGSGAMTTALLKQVLVALVRRSIGSIDLWLQRFSQLADPQIAKAFAKMAAKPGASHSVDDLAAIAGLSRSPFMARFTKVFGKPPMTVLRDLRMRQAAVLLSSGRVSIERAAHDVGYASKSSFLRAFRDVHGCSPADYREAIEVASEPLPKVRPTSADQDSRTPARDHAADPDG